MPDVFTPAKRSEVMSRIRSKGNAATEHGLALSGSARPVLRPGSLFHGNQEALSGCRVF